MGKSSILNALIGEDRTIVSPISGTTRDAIDTEFTGPDGQVIQFDMWLPNVCFDCEKCGHVPENCICYYSSFTED